MSTLNTALMNTKLPSDWIEKVVAGNPAALLPSGLIRLPPARLAFAQVAKPGKDRIEDGVSKPGSYGGTLLFTPGANLDALVNARKAKIAEFFPNNPTGAGLKPVIKDQADHVAAADHPQGANPTGKTYAGFVPGCAYLSPNANLDYKPGLSELVNGVPTGAFGPPDELQTKFYSGCWVIATVNIFHGKNSKNPNAFLGLQSVLKIADDNAFQGGGGSGDPTADYAGLNIESPVNPQSLFG